MDVLQQGPTPSAKRRRRFSSLIALPIVAVALCAAQGAAAAEKKYAFLVGLNDYQLITDGIVELKFAVNDVDVLAERLRGFGYEVKTRVNDNATRREILAELQRYAFKVQPTDTFLLFFAGHGVRRTWGTPATYWLTYAATPSVIDHEGIRLNHLLEYVQDIRAERKIVLLDHCFSGDVGAVATTGSSSVELGSSGPAAAPGSDSAGRAAGDPSLGLRRGVQLTEEFRSQVAAPPNAKGLVLLAAATNEALELQNIEHGAFTEAILRAMTARDPAPNQNLTVAQLVAAVKGTVPTLTNNKQDVTDYQTGANLGSWVLFEKLPASAQAQANRAQAAAQAKVKKEEYAERLIVWENENLFDFDTRIRCEEALTNWLKSLEQGLPLSTTDDRIVNAVRNHVENKTASSTTLADSLKRQVARLLSGSGPVADPQ